MFSSADGTVPTAGVLISAVAGILLTLCQADAKHKEAVVKAKAGPDSCCQVLHGCLACQDCIPRHVVALLASLASSPAVSSMWVLQLQNLQAATKSKTAIVQLMPVATTCYGSGSWQS
jgi:hypothetical protein